MKKTFKIIWDRNALDNFKEILSFLAKQSDQAPKIVKEAIITRLELSGLTLIFVSRISLKKRRILLTGRL